MRHLSNSEIIDAINYFCNDLQGCVQLASVSTGAVHNMSPVTYWQLLRLLDGQQQLADIVGFRFNGTAFVLLVP